MTRFDPITAPTPPRAAKRDGRREPFQRDKVLQGVRLACVKRPVPESAIESLVESVRTRAVQDGHAEVPSLQIGEWVLERLRPLDGVAAFRFASVLHNPGDFSELEREIELASQREPTEPTDDQQPALPGMDAGPGSEATRQAGS